MTRLILLSLFLASTAIADWPSPYLPNKYPASLNKPHLLSRDWMVAARLNLRMYDLYNAKDFSTLVKELYNENAVVEVTKYGIKVKGHQQIEALLSNTAFGKIDKIDLRSVWNVKPGQLYAMAIMTFSMLDGRQVKYGLKETIDNGKFSHFIQEHMD